MRRALSRFAGGRRARTSSCRGPGAGRPLWSAVATSVAGGWVYYNWSNHVAGYSSPPQCQAVADAAPFAVAVADPPLPVTVLEAALAVVWRWLCGLLEGAQIAYRASELMLNFAPAILTSPLLLLRDPASPQSRWWWSLLRESIRRSGPCNTKFSQWIATRPDLFPLVLCQQLQDLQTNAIRFSWPTTEKTLQAMFGPNWHDIFSLEIDPKTREPIVIGSGCVAQVLKGQLLESGQTIVVKVIHPTVAKAIEDDIRIMRFVSRLVESIPSLGNLGLSESVEEFSTFMNSQLDLRREAASLVRFRKNFETGGSSTTAAAQQRSISNSNSSNNSNTVHFPEPMYPHVTRRALVESFVEGQLMLDLMHSIDAPMRHRLATMGLDAILKMVFADNFIHADMHMVRPLIVKLRFLLLLPPCSNGVSQRTFRGS